MSNDSAILHLMDELDEAHNHANAVTAEWFADRENADKLTAARDAAAEERAVLDRLSVALGQDRTG